MSVLSNISEMNDIFRLLALATHGLIVDTLAILEADCCLRSMFLHRGRDYRVILLFMNELRVCFKQKYPDKLFSQNIQTLYMSSVYLIVTCYGMY